MAALTLDQVKAHLRVEHDLDDELIALYLAAAYERVTNYIEVPMADPEPASLQAAVLLFTGDLYENREAQLEMRGSMLENKAAEALMRPFRDTGYV